MRPNKLPMFRTHFGPGHPKLADHKLGLDSVMAAADRKTFLIESLKYIGDAHKQSQLKLRDLSTQLEIERANALDLAKSYDDIVQTIFREFPDEASNILNGTYKL